MARRRVFRTRARCPGIVEDLGLIAKQKEFLGRTVELQNASEAEVNVVLDRTVVGKLDERISEQVATALARGQVFNAVIEKAGQFYAEDLERHESYLDLKVEYMLDKGFPGIEYPKVDSPVQNVSRTSFFTKVAGVTHEGRQRIVA